jgi:putative ABC transport system permease protein
VIGVRTLLRALRHRAGISVVILLVALCASAAATVGPTYYVAAKHSILQDTLTSVSVIGRGLETLQQGPVQGQLDSVERNQASVMASTLGGGRATQRLFAPPVEATETLRFFPSLTEQALLVWRSDVCAHLHLRSGRCPSNAKEIMISASLAAQNGWRLGQRITPASTPPLVITGIYDVPQATQDYWFARGTVYFPNEQPTPQSSPFDAMFTPQSTIEQLNNNTQGSVVASRTLQVANVMPQDVDALSRLGNRVINTASFGPITVTSLTTTVQSVHSSWNSLAVPVLVITAELLALTWLLLFLIVTDAVEARGSEIALAKMRGYGTGRTVLFGIGEPASLLAIALPAGAVIGWLITHFLARVLLRAGTPVGLPGLGWLGAAVAVLGGVAAVAVAARRTLVRPVVEEWRRASRRATDRSWLFDAIVLTAAVAGLVQLTVGGSLSSTKHSALALVVPGILGLAVAVVASRLLPIACRALFARTRVRGSLGPFLAVRHIARRPGGTRTTMILGTAVALATFSIASWSVSNDNRAREAQVSVGAPTILAVAAAPGKDLADAVNRADPSGVHAAAVDTYFSGNNVTLAVQPERFAHVAHWAAVGVNAPGSLLSGLHPAAPPSVILQGDQLRIHARIDRLSVPSPLTIDVVASTSSAPTPVEFGTVHSGQLVDRVADLSGCPCVVSDMQLTPGADVEGDVTLTGLETRTAGGPWQPVGGAANVAHWVDPDNQRVTVTSTSDGLRWGFFATKAIPATLHIHDRPDPLPAIIADPVAPPDVATTTANGLDGANLQVAIAGRVAEVPSAPRNGIIVDLDYATRAAYRSIGPSTPAVWVRGPVAPIVQSLSRSGIPVLGSTSSSAVAEQLGRQGPALASVLFLADAAAAAILAGLAAILSLSAAARRRRYEYAALGATGADRRTLFTALAIEQLAVVGFGSLAGVIAGLASLSLAGHNVPEFVQRPVATLDYAPNTVLMVVTIGLGFVLLFGAALLAAAALLRSVTPEQLREAPT